MENSKSKFLRTCYTIAVISIILIIVILSKYLYNINKTSQEIEREMQIYNARIISDYMKEFFQGRKSELSLIAAHLSDINIHNRKNLKRLFLSYDNLFDNISLIGTDGVPVYGTINGAAGEDGFKSALLGHSTIADEFTETLDGKYRLCMYMPVASKKGKIKAVLVVSFLNDTLEGYMADKVLSSDSCTFVLNNTGTVIFGSSQTEEFIGKSGTSYFFFMKACDIITKNINPDYILHMIHKQKEISLEYKYGNQSYISACVPVGINDFSVTYLSKRHTTAIDKNIFSARNKILFRILLIDITFVFVLFFYIIKYSENIKNLLGKYKIVDEHSEAALFEYTFQPIKQFKMYGDCEKLLGKKINTLMGEAVYDVYDIVHKEDVSVRGKVREFFESTQENFSSEIRLLHTDGEYRWFRITGTISRNEIGQCIRFIGKMTNANKQISMEKNLVKRAENDLLTGVLNKKTIEARITESLKNENDGKNYIFYMVDLDNFKNVNDTLGHIFGDRAIADTANVLKKIFHDNAYVGRLGGDEFAVCAIYDAFDEESLMKFIEEHAQKVCAANRREYSDGVNTVKISSSIGIAIGPKDGRTFEMLYKKADECLYKSKKSGKNKYTIFDHYTVFNR